jgi:hypothetical protein
LPGAAKQNNQLTFFVEQDRTMKSTQFRPVLPPTACAAASAPAIPAPIPPACGNGVKINSAELPEEGAND